MLKVKDFADLKELEKFGLHKEKVYYGYVYTDKNIENKEKNRTIDTWDYLECTDLDEYNDTLYDLIKADLIEKVNDK